MGVLNLWRGRVERLKQPGTRKYPRIQTTFRVECTLENQTFHWPAATLGGGGLFLKTKEVLPTGSKVLVRFRPARHLPFIRAEAKVRYSLPGQGIALEFTQISPQDRETLLRFIHRKVGDSRKFPRAPLATQIHCENLMSLAFARNVSEGGMFIETREPLPLGSRLHLRFNLEDEGPIVVAVGEVVYEISHMGMGVQFVDIEPSDRKRIEAYAAKHGLSAEPVPGVSPAG